MKLTLSTNCQVVMARSLLTTGEKLNGSRGRLRMKGTGFGSGLPKVKANLLKPATN